MRGRSRAAVFVVVALFSAGLVTGGLPAQATTWSVNSDATLRAALHPTTGAQNGDTITFTSNITLSDDLPAVQRNITIDGANKTLSGNDPYRGLFVAKWEPGTANFQDVSVAIRALTIENCKAKGGAADIQTRAGGGGGFGGGLFVANKASVALDNVAIRNNSAVGGLGGAGPEGGGGGGMGGNGTRADFAPLGIYLGGGGGGLGARATGATNASGTPTVGAGSIALGAAGGGNGISATGGSGGAGGAGGGGGGLFGENHPDGLIGPGSVAPTVAAESAAGRHAFHVALPRVRGLQHRWGRWFRGRRRDIEASGSSRAGRLRRRGLGRTVAARVQGSTPESGRTTERGE